MIKMGRKVVRMLRRVIINDHHPWSETQVDAIEVDAMEIETKDFLNLSC